MMKILCEQSQVYYWIIIRQYSQWSAVDWPLIVNLENQRTHETNYFDWSYSSDSERGRGKYGHQSYQWHLNHFQIDNLAFERCCPYKRVTFTFFYDDLWYKNIDFKVTINPDACDSSSLLHIQMRSPVIWNARRSKNYQQSPTYTTVRKCIFHTSASSRG